MYAFTPTFQQHSMIKVQERNTFILFSKYLHIHMSNTFIHKRSWFWVFASARRAQQPGLRCQSFVLLDVVLLEAHGDPLGHLQVLLQTQLRAAGLKRQRALAATSRRPREATVQPQKTLTEGGRTSPRARNPACIHTTETTAELKAPHYEQVRILTALWLQTRSPSIMGTDL